LNEELIESVYALKMWQLIYQWCCNWCICVGIWYMWDNLFELVHGIIFNLCVIVLLRYGIINDNEKGNHVFLNCE